ncbi:MAG: T9SS C-terminal target domain-containing protein [Bacteroidota bacterium]
MKTTTTTIVSIALITILSLPCGRGWGGVASARENIGGSGIAPNNNQAKSVMAGCVNATAQADLDINNVRAKILNGGDMWWDLFGNNEARYAVPKPPVGQVGPSSQFASSVWVGGYDAGGSLKSAAQTYRQFGGNDYWPGPLTSSATITPSTCIAWDKFYKINRVDVETYYNWAVSQSGQNPLLGTQAMDVINNWPAYGPEGQPLAPYFDVNADGFYDPSSGDVPDFDITGTRGCTAQLYGDQCLFWVFNDKGNVHTETGGASIGLEIQAQAFAFATNDELNNATFYKYKIINKSSFRLDSTFFGVWDDADLGWYKDDYVGCDVNLGFGILYNGVAVDGTGQATAYGANPPAVGIDFFEGPFADPDGLDNAVTSVPSSFLNYGDGIADNERLGMCKFMYFNNNASPVNGNPTAGDDFYQYLTGTWRNGTRITYGGNGTTGSVGCNYMFPGLTDPSGFGVGGDLNNPITMPNWDEVSENNVPDDRRFLQSAGPFTLQPGAVNVITIGVPWARATQGGPLASVALLRGADSKAQLLFNNCFATLNGPTAPNLAIQELDKELILTWSNPTTSNNFGENYHEDYDKQDPNNAEYLFQGYQVYQLKNGFVSQTDLGDIDKARLVLQCDKVDAVSQIVNYTNDVTLSALVPTEMVNGSNKGIRHSISVTEDLFATDNKNLVNHKTYYYAVIAYGHSTTIIPNFNSLQDYKPYIAGRKNADFPVFTPHTGIPHIPSPESGGLEQQSNYGNGPKLTRIEGTGNGGNILDFTSATVSAILADPASRAKNPTYENGAGPVTIQVVDPLNVPSETNFRFLLYSNPTTVTSASTWDLINLTTGDTVHSDTTIAIANEQLINGQPVGLNSAIPKWGLSVNVFFVNSPGFISAGPPAVYPENNSFLEATMTFADPSKAWLSGIADEDGESNFNWIRSGTTTFDGASAVYNDYVGVDDIQAYEKVLEGTWAPYRLCGSTPTTTPNPIIYSGGPAWGGFITLNQIKNTSSVDIVITSDQSKWTRCPVLELQEETALAIGGTKKMHMRSSLSVDKNGLNSSQSGYNASEGDLNGATGMGWFPGYALNLETGERLNMAFGEDSWLATENGADMKWNPSSTTMSSLGDAILFGGKHYIYVFGHYGDASYTGDAQMGNGLSDVPRYDGGKTVHDLLAAAAATATTVSDGYKRNVFSDVMWVNIPMLNQGRTVLETDVKIRLRVTRAYSKYGTGEQVPSGSLVVGENYFVEYGPVVHNGISRAIGTTFVAADASWTATVANPSVLSTVNKADPIYEFNTSDIGTRKEEAVAAEDALSLINIVPNPYYAYSGYEQKTSDNIVKITNLPRNCTVSIYTLNGTLIRTITKADDDIKASLDWDMKNQARIPIASGMYIIHVDVPNVGEKILKWFGVMRPLDLEAY